MVIVEKKVTFIVLTALVCLAEVVSENYRNTRPVGRFGFLSRLFGLDKYLSILGHNDFKKKSLKLENVKCISDLNGSGICTTTNYCLEQGGQVSGDCRRERSVIHGFKCCTFSATCGDEIIHNGTIFVSPGFPKKFLEPEYCQTRVDVGYNICQLRIDFLHFTLAPPRSERPNSGKCLDDVFTVVADRGGSKIPSLCGDNSGQHVYVDVALSKQAVLNVQISPIHFSRKWAIQILQIPCGSPASAPFGCLQYFTGSSNVIKSFNYSPQPTGIHFLNDLSYTMCIRRELGFCSISYSEGERGGFDIGPHSKPATGPHCCRLAYLLIPTGSTGSEGLGNVGDRFCGRGLSPTGVVSSKIFPFEISFVSTIHMDETPFTQESDRHYRRFVSGRQMTGFIESTGNHTNNSESKRKRTQNSKFMRWFPDEESDHFYDKNTTLLGINDIKTSSMEITSKRQSFKDLKKPQTGKLVSNTENKGSFSYNNTKLDNKTSFTKHGLINSVVKKPKDDIKVGETFYNINYVLSYKINEVTQCDDKCNNGCRGKCINFCNNHEFEADIDIRKCRGNCYRTASDKCKENCRKQCEKDSVKQHNSEMYDENYDNEIDDDDSEGVEASDDDVKENNAENLEIRSSPVTKRFCVLNCETLCRGRCNNFCSDLPYKIEKILCRRKCKNSCPRKCFRVCDMDEDLECDCECGEITTGLCRHICQLKSLRHHWKAAGFNIYYSQNPCF